MTIVLALGVAVLFGTGSYMMLKTDLIRVVVGMVLISHAANLFIIASALTRGGPPVQPLLPGETYTDPLVQAMALTAIVISFAVAALLLAIVYRVYTSHFSLDLDELGEAEQREEALIELETLVGAAPGMRGISGPVVVSPTERS
jgi:multicomponent Na+:H+ antiporter subunit C